MYVFAMFDVNSLLIPQLATAGPRYLIAGPTNPFNSENINELILLNIWIKNPKEILQKPTN